MSLLTLNSSHFPEKYLKMSVKLLYLSVSKDWKGGFNWLLIHSNNVMCSVLVDNFLANLQNIES